MTLGGSPRSRRGPSGAVGGAAPTVELGFIDTPEKPWLTTAVATYIPGASYVWHWGDGRTTTWEGNIATHVYQVADGGSFNFEVRCDVKYPLDGGKR